MKYVYGIYLFVFALFCGWIANIVKLIGVGFAVSQWGGMEVARVIGIFVPPMGAVLGFF